MNPTPNIGLPLSRTARIGMPIDRAQARSRRTAFEQCADGDLHRFGLTLLRTELTSAGESGSHRLFLEVVWERPADGGANGSTVVVVTKFAHEIHDELPCQFLRFERLG